MAFECDVCGNEYDSKQALGGHKSVAHSKKECKYCGKAFSPHVLKKHQNKCSKKPSTSKCDNCGKKHDETYGSGRFCGESCAKSFATKDKRQEINEKVSETLYGQYRNRVELLCEWCDKKFEVKESKSDQNYCSISCAQKDLWSDESYREKMIEKLGSKNVDLDERRRLRKIGRKGGFGNSGETYFGVKYESSLEKDCFEILYEEKINFEPHPEIPGTSKVSDAYVPSEDIYIEIDGIGRERLKDNDNLDWYDRWKSKMNLYDDLGLEVVVVKNVNEMKNFIGE